MEEKNSSGDFPPVAMISVSGDEEPRNIKNYQFPNGWIFGFVSKTNGGNYNVFLYDGERKAGDGLPFMEVHTPVEGKDEHSRVMFVATRIDKKTLFGAAKHAVYPQNSLLLHLCRHANDTETKMEQMAESVEGFLRTNAERAHLLQEKKKKKKKKSKKKQKIVNDGEAIAMQRQLQKEIDALRAKNATLKEATANAVSLAEKADASANAAMSKLQSAVSQAAMYRSKADTSAERLKSVQLKYEKEMAAALASDNRKHSEEKDLIQAHYENQIDSLTQMYDGALKAIHERTSVRCPCDLLNLPPFTFSKTYDKSRAWTQEEKHGIIHEVTHRPYKGTNSFMYVIQRSVAGITTRSVLERLEKIVSLYGEHKYMDFESYDDVIRKVQHELFRLLQQFWLIMPYTMGDMTKLGVDKTKFPDMQAFSKAALKRTYLEYEKSESHVLIAGIFVEATAVKHMQKCLRKNARLLRAFDIMDIPHEYNLATSKETTALRKILMTLMKIFKNGGVTQAYSLAHAVLCIAVAPEHLAEHNDHEMIVSCVVQK